MASVAFEEPLQIVVEILPGHREQNLEMQEKATGIDLLRRLGLPPDGHILVRGDVPIPADEALADGERVRVIAVVSGGSGE
jgi:sulfur carrier protein ThiS